MSLLGHTLRNKMTEEYIYMVENLYKLQTNELVKMLGRITEELKEREVTL